MEALVEDSKQLMGFTLGLDRDEFFDLTNKIRVALPDEVRKASRVTAESERIVGTARETAEQTLMDAQQEAQRTQQTAQSAAERVTKEADQRAQQRVQESESTATRIANDAKSQAGLLVQQAQDQAEKIVVEAQQRAETLVSDSEIMRLAAKQAKEIIANAEYEAHGMRRGGEEYAREELVRLEKVLSDGLLTVQRGRMKLDQRLGSVEASDMSSAPPSRSMNGRNGDHYSGNRR